MKILTVYAFSTENISRETEEVKELMYLFEKNFRKLADDKRVHKHGIKVNVLGQWRKLPESVQKSITYALDRTKNYNNYIFNLAVAYGGREEIISAIREIARK